MVVAEASTSWPGVTAPVEWGGLGFTRKWNLGWMHDTLTYFSHDPVHRRFHHHDLTFPMVYAGHERWVLPLSHDEVVHGKGSLLDKMPGDEWQRFANLRCLLAWQWCHPGRQLLFMGGELAQGREWSHDRELDWSLCGEGNHDGVTALVAELNRVAAEHPALWRGDGSPGAVWWLDADRSEESTFAFGRYDPVLGDHLVCVANLTPVPRPGYRLGLPLAGEWRVVLGTDDERYGGSGHAVGVVAIDDELTWQGQPASAVLTLPPLSVMWLAPGSG
jgi:1,4-alpha-glucan branching enzyme